jgi:hypothetical protein
MVAVSMAPGCAGGRRAPEVASDSAVVLAPGSGGIRARAALVPQALPEAWIGERMVYRLSLLGVEIGEYAVELALEDGLVRVVAATRSTGVASLLGEVRVELTSLLERATGLPVRVSTREQRSHTPSQWTVQLAERAAEQVTLQVQRDDLAAATEAQRVRGALWDVNSAMMALRLIEGGAGSGWTFEALRTTMVWRVSVEVSGRVMLASELGKLPALRLDGHAQQLRRDGEPGDEPLRRFSLWISADAARVPLRLQASTSYGDVRMELVEYTSAFDEGP